MATAEMLSLQVVWFCESLAAFAVAVTKRSAACDQAFERGVAAQRRP